jgi:hypothetical protein
MELRWQWTEAKTQSARDWFMQVRQLGEAIETANR